MADATTSFFVHLASTRMDVRDACAVRSRAYGHHLPQVTDTYAEPDPLDRQGSVGIVLCRDKASGEAIGTMRIQRSPFGPLQLEKSVILPHWLAHQPKAELTRLAVARGACPQTRLMLMKAGYLYCLATQIRWMVIGARSEALIRVYRHLGFRDVLGPDDMVPLRHAGNLPHRILAFDVTGAERTWRAAGHRLYEFMIETYHPDLQLFQDRAPARTGRELDANDAAWEAQAA